MDSNMNKHCNNSLEGYDIYVNSEKNNYFHKNNEEVIKIMRIVRRVIAIIVIFSHIQLAVSPHLRISHVIN